jgi:hypothetical protein
VPHPVLAAAGEGVVPGQDPAAGGGGTQIANEDGLGMLA